jgi:hypothetical protein
MRIESKVVLAAFLMASLALPVFAQAPARPTRSTIKPMPNGQTPFTAEFKTTTVKTLANGSTITREGSEVQAADSHGRTVTSTSTEQPSGDMTTYTFVSDPAAGTRTSWTTPGQQAMVVSTHPAAGANCAQRAQQNPPNALRRTSTTEDLGTETIEGVEAHGRRITTTTPAGMVGNSEPLVSTHEVWSATSIKPFSLVLRQVDDDPQGGKTTREATRVSLSEPDASLFQPPAGYEAVARDPAPAACPAVRTAPAPAEAQQ